MVRGERLALLHDHDVAAADVDVAVGLVLDLVGGDVLNGGSVGCANAASASSAASSRTAGNARTRTRFSNGSAPLRAGPSYRTRSEGVNEAGSGGQTRAGRLGVVDVFEAGFERAAIGHHERVVDETHQLAIEELLQTAMRLAQRQTRGGWRVRAASSSRARQARRSRRSTVTAQRSRPRATGRTRSFMPSASRRRSRSAARCASRSITCTAMSGRSRHIARNMSRSRRSRRASVAATARALRARPSSESVSPTESPGPRRATSRDAPSRSCRAAAPRRRAARRTRRPDRRARRSSRPPCATRSKSRRTPSAVSPSSGGAEPESAESTADRFDSPRERA